VERAAQQNDKLIIDLKGSLEGIDVPDVAAADLTVDLGGNELLAGFDELLIGEKANTTSEKPFTFPAEHVNKAIAGKQLLLTITIKEVAEAELPALDEAFFEKLHLEEKTLAALEEKLKEAITKEIERTQFFSLKKQVFTFLNEANPIEVPASLVANQANELRQQVRQRLEDAAATIANMNDTLSEQLNSQAEQTVRVSLLLAKYIQDNHIVADEARVNEQLMSLLMPYAMRDQAMFRQLLSSPMPKQIAQNEVLEELAIEHIISEITLNEKEMPLEDLLKLATA